MRAHDLAGDTDIRKARLGTQGKGSRRTTLEQPFVGRKALGCPVLAPILDRFGIGAKRLREMVADAWHNERMRMAIVISASDRA